MERSIRPLRRRSNGFTVIEVVLGITVIAILARMLIAATDSIGAMTEAGNTEAHLAQESEAALQSILDDLRRSGFQDDINGLPAAESYPYVFEPGTAAGFFAAHDYVPAPQAAQPGDIDFGPIGSIVLCVPSDLDGNGRPEVDVDADGTPELDGNGDGVLSDDASDVAGLWDPARATIDPDTGVVWSRDEVSYVLTASPTGQNELVRLVGNGAAGRRVVARSVERIQFFRNDVSNLDPLSNTVRVELYFRATDADGRLYRTSSEATVKLRNSN